MARNTSTYRTSSLHLLPLFLLSLFISTLAFVLATPATIEEVDFSWRDPVFVGIVSWPVAFVYLRRKEKKNLSGTHIK
jgi:hypothetical protein